MVKVILMLEHGYILPNADFQSFNPEVASKEIVQVRRDFIDRQDSKADSFTDSTVTYPVAEQLTNDGLSQ